ncbi:MAG: hypothetical protein LQ343_001332 [Gyalolechia ehrenbergii]|nr:MAG: hypothetical protein LQ343_001332 [Gyalolechia ehrenbergii]
MLDLYNTLNTSSSIRSLSLKISESGCVIGTNSFAFPFKRGDRFPLSQRLDGYDFSNTKGVIRESHKRAIGGFRGLPVYLANEYEGYEWLCPERLQLQVNRGGDLRMWRDAMD